jgi:hypothetical protein
MIHRCATLAAIGLPVKVVSGTLSAIGINLGGWLGYLIAGFIACLLIWIARLVTGARRV